MTQVTALTTIHRPGKRKGEQNILLPGESFDCTGEEYAHLHTLGAIAEVPGKSNAKADSKRASSPEKKANAAEGDAA